MTTAYRIILRSLLTRGRLLFLGGLAILPLFLAMLIRSRALDAYGATYDSLIRLYSLGLLAPVVSLVFGSAALGDLVDDRSLVWLWLAPQRRAVLALAALGATLTAAVPLVVLPAALAPLLAGTGDQLAGAAAATTALATAAYGATFVALGFRVRRALAWGLAYVLIWEGAVARVARGAARASIQVQAQSLLADLTSQPPPRNAVAASTAVVASLAVIAVAVAVTARWLRTADVA